MLELRESANGKIMELVVNAHKRIRILEPLETEEKPLYKATSRKVPLKKAELKKKESKPNNDEGEPMKKISEGERKIIYARTENVIMDTFEKTQEIKV